MPSKIQLDENLWFLFVCLQKSDYKAIDFNAVGDATNLKPPAARMRYTRLKRQIESGTLIGTHGTPFAGGKEKIAEAMRKRKRNMSRKSEGAENDGVGVDVGDRDGLGVEMKRERERGGLERGGMDMRDGRIGFERGALDFKFDSGFMVRTSSPFSPQASNSTTNQPTNHLLPPYQSLHHPNLTHSNLTNPSYNNKVSNPQNTSNSKIKIEPTSHDNTSSYSSSAPSNSSSIFSFSFSSDDEDSDDEKPIVKRRRRERRMGSAKMSLGGSGSDHNNNAVIGERKGIDGGDIEIGERMHRISMDEGRTTEEEITTAEQEEDRQREQDQESRTSTFWNEVKQYANDATYARDSVFEGRISGDEMRGGGGVEVGVGASEEGVWG